VGGGCLGACSREGGGKEGFKKGRKTDMCTVNTCGKEGNASRRKGNTVREKISKSGGREIPFSLKDKKTALRGGILKRRA